jgi:hypothetical protein
MNTIGLNKTELQALHTLLHRIGSIEGGDVYMIGHLSEEKDTSRSFAIVADAVHRELPGQCICDF